MQEIFADDELIIVQAVSKSGKSFVVRRGAQQGVAIGQESLFSTKDASFTAKVIEVNRFFSLWNLKDNRGAVPFNKGEYVTYTNNIENIWTEIPKLQLAPKEELVFRQSSEWIARLAYGLTMSESVSEADDDNTANRTSFQFEGVFANRIAVHWEWGVGFRLDRDNATLNESNLDVPTSRYMITAELNYHFANFARSDDNMYLGAAIAYGLSNTTVNESISTGTSLVLPIVKLGYIKRVSPSYALVFEGSFEAIAQSESFEDTDTQTTNIVNSKMSIGVRF
jgi:hypothetical protein